MGGKIQIIFILVVLAALFSSPLSAVKPKKKTADEDVVHIIKGESLELVEIGGQQCRKAVATTFMHNGTTLVSDTAFWYVDQKLINAQGHVRLIQGDVTVTSDKIDYDIDASLAQFRGELVQLKDRKNNVLRTRYLDYNTKDSIAIFVNGGAMKGEDGQIIEGNEGEYDSKLKRFSFIQDVNMFTDSIFVRTDRLEYYSDTKTAFFRKNVDFWKDDKMLSSEKGWYDRRKEVFFFYDSVHAQSERQEAWSDSLYFYKIPEDVLMLQNAQIQDTSSNVAAIANRIFYDKSEARMTLTEQAAVAVRTRSGEKTDTLFCGADSLIYYTLARRDIPDSEFAESAARLEDLNSDPVTLYRRKAAKEAADKAAEERRKKEEAGDINPNKPLDLKGLKSHKVEKDGKKETRDSSAPQDTLKVPADTLKTPVDSSKTYGFAIGLGNVRMFREDMQMSCDSLRYSEIDSIGRFYINPVIWNEGDKQYSADSLYLLVKNGDIDRASLLSNAMVIAQKDTICYDQIKSTEMMTFFSDGKLRRFDALGGASVMFFFEENGKLATANKVDSKMLSALFSNGELDRVYYFDNTKNDAVPIVEMTREELYMKGFNWDAERRPMSRDEITDIQVRETEREVYDSHPRAEFPYTDDYFSGYMEEVYRKISEGRVAREEADTVSASGPAPMKGDTLSVKDTAGLKPVAPKDSLSVVRDSLSSGQDSLKTVSDTLSPAQRKVLERKKAREAREAAKNAKWDDLDRRDAEKKAARLAKRRERKRAKTREALLLKRKQDAIDDAKRQKYVEKFERRKARKEKRLKPTEQ